MHSLFVAENPIHILYWWESVVVNAGIRPVSFDASESFVHGVEGLLPIRDARQEQAIVKLSLQGLRIYCRLDLFLSFFFY